MNMPKGNNFILKIDLIQGMVSQPDLTNYMAMRASRTFDINFVLKIDIIQGMGFRQDLTTYMALMASKP